MNRRVLVALLTCAVAMVVPSTAAAGPAGRTCPPPKYPGAGYFTTLTVKGASCATGRKVALAYYRCRTRGGKKGRCTKRVLGYRCSERRYAIPTEINARVSCRSGARTVTHTYQQNT